MPIYDERGALHVDSRVMGKRLGAAYPKSLVPSCAMEGLATGGGWVLSSERNVVGSWKAFGQAMQGMWKSRRLLPMGVVARLTVEQIPS